MQPQLGGSWLLLSAILVLTCTPVVQYAQAYCWEPGKNPSFTGPPVVEQVDIRQVRVSWFGLVSQRNCADQFLVKYWQKTSPQGELFDVQNQPWKIESTQLLNANV